MNPTPFQLAQGIGNQFEKGFRSSEDRSALDQILSEASQSNDPNDLNNAIGQILSRVSPDRQPAAIKVLENKLDRLKPKAPVGGLSGQPVPDEASKAIEYVVKNNKDASADELAMKFDAAGIPRAYSNSYIENRRRMDETGSKNTVEKIKQDRKEQLKFHDDTAKYDAKLMDSASKAQNQLSSIMDIEEAVDSNNVSPMSLSNMFRSFGEKGRAFSDAILNKDEATILANIPYLLEGWKDVFGIRLTDADLKLLEGKLPGIGKSKEANKAIISVMKKYAKQAELKNTIGDEIKEANNGLRPLGYDRKVEKRFKEMTESVKIINPRNGRVIEIPAYELSAAMKSGAKLANE